MDILFSCVGTTDPVKNYHDGGILHILRNYPSISKVFLFMSKEMWEKHIKTNMYNLAFDDFKERTKRNFDVEYLKTDLINVDDYDLFFDSFSKHIQDLYQKYDNSKIYLNLSSGTPAMKVSLALVAVDNPRKNIIPVQVGNPLKRSDSGNNTSSKNYDVIDQCLNNKDFIENSKRCKEPKLIVFLRNKVKNQIIAMLNNYNYEAALTIYKEYYNNKNIKLLLEHAKKRLQLEKDNKNNVKKIEEAFGFTCYPINNEEIEKIIEYFLLLQTLVKNNKTTEFLLRLNPFTIRLGSLFLKIKFKFNINKFINNRKNELIPEKLEQSYPKVYKYLSQEFSPLETRSMSVHLICLIIKYLSKDEENEKLFNALDRINAKYRNSAAHELRSVTDSDLRNDNNIKMHSQKILNDIWEFMIKFIGNHFPHNIKNLYDDINKIIISHL